MLIELYKDPEELINDFESNYPNVNYLLIPLNNIHYYLFVYSNDLNLLNTINGEVFRFQGIILTESRPMVWGYNDDDQIIYKSSLHMKTNIKCDDRGVICP